MLNKDIEYTRGNSYVLDVRIKGISKIDKIYMTIKKSADDDDYILQKSLNNGIEEIKHEEEQEVPICEFRIKITPDETENFIINYNYGYDIKIIVGDIKKTIVIGDFKMTKNYTKKINEV